MNNGKHAFIVFFFGSLMLSITIWWVGFPVQIALLVLLIASLLLPKDLKKGIPVVEMTLYLILLFFTELFGEVRWIVFLAADYLVFFKVVLILLYAYTWLKVFARVLPKEESEKLKRHVLVSICLCGTIYPFMLNLDESLVLGLVFGCVVKQIYVIILLCQAIISIGKQPKLMTDK